MTNNNDKKVLNVPHLRFPEFSGEWKKCKFGDIATGFDYGMNAAAKPFDGENKYIRITDIDEASSQYLYDDVVSPDGELGDSYLVKENDILLARTGASTGKSYLYRNSDGKLYFAGFLIRANIYKHNSYFVFSQLHTHRYKKWISVMSARSGQPGINSQEYASFPLYTTSLQEEDKIASFLKLLDERIATQNKIIEKLETLIKGIRHNIFKQLRKDVGSNATIDDILSFEQPQRYIVSSAEYSNDDTLIKGIRHNIFKQLRKDVGSNATIDDILSFEQPQRYIVSSAEYSNDDTFTPVLTANKAFILGYTTETDGIYDKGDCIIIDDFTLDCKYVSFPFKVKSSAIKILTANNKFILRYTYEYLKSLELSTEEHKRHYIAEVQPHSCVLPDNKTLKIIALMFERIADKLANEQLLAFMLNKQKQYLLSKMFI